MSGTGVAVASETVLDEPDVERVEVGEVVVHELSADAGFGGEPGHRDPAEAEAVEEPTCGVEQLPAAVGGSEVRTLDGGGHQ